MRRPAPRPRLVAWSAALGLAATLLVAVTLGVRFARDARAAPGPTLLSSAELTRAERNERRLDREAERLEARLVARGEAELSEDGAALLEELAALDDALGECRGALEANPRHGHLRRQLEELSLRRVALLARVAALAADGGGASGSGRG